jgi:hypothetical protein
VRHIGKRSVEPFPAEAFDSIAEMLRHYRASMIANLNLELAESDQTEFAGAERLESANHHKTNTEKVKNRKFQEISRSIDQRSSAVSNHTFADAREL